MHDAAFQTTAQQLAPRACQCMPQTFNWPSADSSFAVLPGRALGRMHRSYRIRGAVCHRPPSRSVDTKRSRTRQLQRLHGRDHARLCTHTTLTAEQDRREDAPHRCDRLQVNHTARPAHSAACSANMCTPDGCGCVCLPRRRARQRRCESGAPQSWIHKRHRELANGALHVDRLCSAMR